MTNRERVMSYFTIGNLDTPENVKGIAERMELADKEDKIVYQNKITGELINGGMTYDEVNKLFQLAEQKEEV